jgi:hypothetical protein
VSCDVEVQDRTPSMIDHEKAVQPLGTSPSAQSTSPSRRWLRGDCEGRNASHFLPGSPRRTIGPKYRATLLSETAKPSFWSSPWILEHPSRDFLVPGAGSGREFPP